MSDRLPPLTALRAFEAAARHMSFAKAADELNVTPAALSFQIKSLEEHLGQPVFRRLNRAVELTEAGRTLAPGTSDGFEALTTAWRAARRSGNSSTLTVTAGPAFTAKWLAPRLFGFAAAHPEIDLRFSASFRIMDFDRDEIDLAIRFGYGPHAGLFNLKLFDEWVTPMMAPDLAKGVTRPEDLLEMPLLHQDDLSFLKPAFDWPAWFRAAGVEGATGAGARFSQADHALDAALAGAGAVLGRFSLTSDDLAAGRLVAPFDLALTTEAHFSFVCAEGSETQPRIKAFLDWLKGEIDAMPDPAEGRRFVAAADVAI